MSTPPSLEDVAERLRKELNELIGGVTKEQVHAALEQLPKLMERTDWDMDQKKAAIELIQVAVITPFISAVASIGHGSSMELGAVLFHMGNAWEQVRAQRLSIMAEQMLNKGKTEQ